MKKLFKFFTPFLFLFLFVMLSSSHAQQASAFTVSGKLQEANGHSILWGQVSIKDQTTNVVIATSSNTNEDGLYSLSIPEGIYTLQVNHALGYYTQKIISNVSISADRTLDIILDPAPSTVALTGKLLTSQGDVITGATVSLAHFIGTTTDFNSHSNTDTSGTYYMRVFAKDSYSLQIQSSGSSKAPHDYTITGTLPLMQDTTEDLILPVKHINTHVQDPNGNPVDHTAVENPDWVITSFAINGLQNVQAKFADNGITDSSGNIVLQYFPTTSEKLSTSIVAAYPQFPTQFYDTRVTNFAVADDASVTLTLSTIPSVQGRITDLAYNPIAGQTVEITLPDTTQRITQSDWDGNYYLKVPAGNNYHYRLYSNGKLSKNPEYYEISGTFSVAPSQWPTLISVLLPIQTVSVYVKTPSGNPLPTHLQASGPPITLSIPGLTNAQGYSTDSTNGDANGAGKLYLFNTTSSSTNAPYTITATPNTPAGQIYPPTQLTSVTVNGNVEYYLTMNPPATLSGIITDGLGNPIPGNTIQLTQLLPNNVRGKTWSGQTDASGKYSVQVLPGESYEFRTFSATRPTQTTPYYFEFTGTIPLQQDTTLNIQIPLNKVVIHVQDKNGEVISGMQVSQAASPISLNIPSLANVTGYSQDSGTTDINGITTFWQFPTTASATNALYSYFGNPLGFNQRMFQTTGVNNISVSSDTSVTLIMDFVHDSPITNATLSPNPDAQNQYPNSVTVTLSASAFSGFSIANIHYAVDGGASQIYANPFTVSGDGNHTVTYYSTDSLGVYETTKTTSFSITTNHPPVANANGPYSVVEGGSITLQGSATDADNDPLTYSWDLTGGTNFTTQGQTPIFSATSLDGPSTQTVNLQVCDIHNACNTSLATINIFNAAPTVGTITAPTIPQAVNTALTTSVNFTDPGVLDTHTAVWDWGDGSTSTGSISETHGIGTTTGTHTYITAGVYTVQVVVTDKDGATRTNQYQYIVVYDPSAGFVTGAGHIASPLGAEPVLPYITGDAKFGVQAKYLPGSTTPTGNTKFTFKNGGFDFTSTSYDWLVVNGNKAYLHGTGTINNAGSYNFLVTVIDGNPDTFRIKIKDNSTNMIVYDNQMNASDFTDPTETISNGSIKIH